jgi:hypothetical protein
MGQLGRGTVGGDTACADGLPCEAAPAPVVGLEASLLSVGNNVNLALRSDGVLVGWGMNQGAQLGHPPSTGPDVPCAFYDTTPDDVHCAPTPTPVEGLPVAE